MSDGAKTLVTQATTVTNGTTSNIGIRATNDPDGSYLRGGAGDDVLRGGKFDDILSGGRGDDLLFGGDGADSFRFSGNEVGQAGELTDTDKIIDLDFSEGDEFLFTNYSGLSDASGIDARADGTGAYVTSWEGLAHFARQINATFVEVGTTDKLLLSFDAGGGAIQQLEITGGFDAFSTAWSNLPPLPELA